MMEKTGFVCGECGSGEIVKIAGGMQCEKCKKKFPQLGTDSVIDKAASMIEDENKE